MGRLVSLVKGVIADSTPNRSQGPQGQQGGFNNSNVYPRQNQKYGYSREDDYYRDTSQQNYGNQGPRQIYREGYYDDQQRGSGNRSLPPPAYASSYSGRNSPVEIRSLEDGSTQHDSRISYPATQVTRELPQSTYSDTYRPQPQGWDDAAPPAQMRSNSITSYDGRHPQTLDPSYVDDLRDDRNYSLRDLGARTLRGSAPRRQYESEPFIDQGYSSDPRYESRRDRRRARGGGRRANRQGIVSLLKDSIVSSSSSRSSEGRR